MAAWLRSTFPEAAKEVHATHGLIQFEQGHLKSGLDDHANYGKRVILIHGLDEPGRVWMNLAPFLAGHGFDVWLMRYPNDQDIEKSARFFYHALAKKRWGKDSAAIALVAHSMGGLVARQMLTDPRINYGEGIKADRVPAVSHLIMIGTPNHGAALARFRLIMEIREQVLNRIQGYGNWLQGVFDGNGEAASQLLPDSAFLLRLNGRPHPLGVSMTVIAGVISPWLPAGDGLVSTGSARLENVPYYEVPGNHLTIIRNLTRGSTRVPPALPLVLRILSP